LSTSVGKVHKQERKSSGVGLVSQNRGGEGLGVSQSKRGERFDHRRGGSGGRSRRRESKKGRPPGDWEKSRRGQTAATPAQRKTGPRR